MSSFRDDIPLTVAGAAHSGTSFVPDKRAGQERDDYAASMSADWLHFHEQATKGGTLDLLPAEFDRYREGIRRRTIAYLNSRARIVSTMIAGPSGFPSARMQKRNEIARRRVEDLFEYRQRARAAILRTLRPDLAPIMSGDSDAVERLRAELAKLEERQARMKSCNAVIRRMKGDPARCVEALREQGLSEGVAAELLKPDFAGRIGFPDYEIKNNGANIRRVRERLASVERAQAQPVRQVQGAHAQLEDDPPANRVRLLFPGKPDADTRGLLKSRGFRWAPTVGAWQAYRNAGSLELARKVAGVGA